MVDVTGKSRALKKLSEGELSHVHNDASSGAAQVRRRVRRIVFLVMVLILCSLGVSAVVLQRLFWEVSEEAHRDMPALRMVVGVRQGLNDIQRRLFDLTDAKSQQVRSKPTDAPRLLHEYDQLVTQVRDRIGNLLALYEQVREEAPTESEREEVEVVMGRVKRVAEEIEAIIVRQEQEVHEALNRQTSLDAQAVDEMLKQSQRWADALTVLTGKLDDALWNYGRHAESALEQSAGYLHVFIAVLVWMMVLAAVGGVCLLRALGRMIGRLRDVEDDLREQRDAAESAALAKSEFLANMSHEIRTPMTAILGFSDLVLDPKCSREERSMHLQTIRRNGQHLLSVINDILDLSKIEAGQMTIEQIVSSPQEIVEGAVSMSMVRARQRGVEFHVHYDQKLPSMIQTDPTRLRQILLNLITNAIKFTEQGQVRLDIRMGPVDELDHAHLQFVISDTGIGMTRQQVDQLFEPFVQADTSTTRRYGGTGLGLAISRQIAQQMNGDITAQSEPGRGSTFTLDLDLGPAQDLEMVEISGVKTMQHVSDQSTQSNSAGPRGRLLLVEDGPDNQRLIRFLLTRAGHHVDVAENGKVALEMVAETESANDPYDVILMDMQMPELDGYGATSQLRQDGYTRPIVALTAHAMSDDRAACLRVGCDDYLSKPVDAAKLCEMVQTYLGKVTSSAPSSQTPSASPAGGEATDGPPLLRDFAGDPEMAPIIEQFVNGLSEQITQCQAALDQADLDTLTHVAHRLKGSAGGYGFAPITEAARIVEQLSREHEDIDALGRAVDELGDLCRRASAQPAPEKVL